MTHNSPSKAKEAKTHDDDEVPSWNDYKGFSLQRNKDATEPKIPIEDGTIASKAFFEKYIGPRRPCIIDTLPKLASSKAPPCVSMEQLKEVAGDKEVQVERRFETTETFGQNRTEQRQLVMTVSDFVDRLESNDGSLYYLSTQQHEESEGAFDTPCRQLLDNGYISDQAPWAGNLVLHTCNLWMGTSQEGSSSGLHHDYHDNFYLLIRGRKKFRLYSPDCAPLMKTYGTIEKVFENGVISYHGHETRADGVPLADLERKDDNVDADSGDEKESDDDEEEGVFFGKGFDYESDNESSHAFDKSKDDFDEVMTRDNQEPGASDSKTRRPNSFSQIDAKTLQDPASIAKTFPQLAACRECIVHLKEGQTLYLPAGWFHEVTSLNSGKGANHTALNYWYHPPDEVDNFEQPYKDHEFWQEEARTKLAST